MSQVRYEAERAREQAQKQLAATEGRAGVLHTRLDDVLADNRALKHKVSTLLTGSAGCCLQPVPDEPQHSQLWRRCLCMLPSAAHSPACGPNLLHLSVVAGCQRYQERRQMLSACTAFLASGVPKPPPCRLAGRAGGGPGFAAGGPGGQPAFHSIPGRR